MARAKVNGMSDTSAPREGRLSRPHVSTETATRPERAAPDALTIGRRLRHVRQGAERTLGDVAAAVGMSPSALSLIENGKREPRLSVLTSLAEVLDVPLADLSLIHI